MDWARWQANVGFASCEDVAEVLALCALDPVAYVLAEVRLRQAFSCGYLGPYELLRYPQTGSIKAACLVGANVVPINCLDSGAAWQGFAKILAQHRGGYASVVGPAPAVLGLWRHLERQGLQAREIRPSQPSLVLQQAASGRSDPLVRRATLADFPQVLPAAVAMFQEEVGYNPLTPDGSYQVRVRSLIQQQRMFVRTLGEDSGPMPHPGAVVFKAELGALTPQVAQIQGVWTHKEHRGQGLAKGGVARLVELARKDGPQVISLYVNSYNAPALAVYEAVGFRQVGEYATVLL